MPRLFSLACILSCILTACSAVTPAPFGQWESPRNRHHPLTGTLWRVADKQLITQEELLQSMAAARIVILGEKHDNPDHHLLQAHVLEALAARGVLAQVSFEMLDSSQAEGLRAVNGDSLASDVAVQSTLQWDAEGWDWALYGPLLMQTLKSGIELKAANISRDEMLAVYGTALDPAIQAKLNEQQLQRLHEEIDQSHCGMLPESQFAAMVRVQQARDAKMAASLAEGVAGTGVRVLIAGNFHARRDLGVPNYIAAEQGRVLSIAFLEVQAGERDPLAYLDVFSQTLPYDYVWFTPSVEPEDYCAGMRGDTN